MTLLFRKSIESDKFLKVWEAAKNKNTGLSLLEMDNKAYGSKALGYALYDAEATDFQLRFDREFFAENYNGIIDSHETLATYETIIYLIKAALGQNTIVNFETPSPAHLIININEPSVLVEFATLTGDQVMATNQAGTLDELMLKAATSPYTLNQVVTMLKSIEGAGVYVEYNFIKGV